MGVTTLHHAGVRSLAQRKLASTRERIVSAIKPAVGPLVQIGLTLYLLPAIVVVSALSVVTIAALAVREVVWGSVWIEVCRPQERAGQEVFRG